MAPARAASIRAGLLQQQGDPFRPTVALSPRGDDVLAGRQGFPENLHLSETVWRKLSRAEVPPGREEPAELPRSHVAAPPAKPVPPRQSESARAPTTPLREQAAPRDHDHLRVSARPATNPPPALKPPPVAAPAALQANGSATTTVPHYHWTCVLLDRGFSVAECAAIRRVEPHVILEHAIAAVRAGRTVRIQLFAEHHFEGSAAKLAKSLLELK